MTHRPYTPPAWQSKLLADGRVTLLVVPLKVQPKYEYRSWETNLPYATGDLIWCRETYIGPYAYEVNEYKPKDWGNKPIWFPADGPIPERFVGQFWHKARSPVTMPKWAARTWLRVTGVEVRRVQTISEDEALSVVPRINGKMSHTVFSAYFPNFSANPWAAFTTVEKISKEDV